MNQKLIIGIVAIIIVVAGVGIYSSNSSKTEMMEKEAMVAKENLEMEQQKEATMQKEKEVMEAKEGAMVKPDGAMMQKEEGAMMVKAGSYESYEASKIAMASATHDVVLFFHASWCPSCRALNSDIEKNVSAIPAGVTILKTDYDKETELKKKYGVTTQHTLVQVDKDGTLIKKWSGGSKLENLLSQVQ
jgi:thiol-disulfide isomerase/thioredoxin